MRLCLDDFIILDFKVHLVGIHAIHNAVILQDNVLYAHLPLVTETAVIDHKRIPGVEGINLEWSFVNIIVNCIREYHTERGPANGKPISKLFILRRLILGEHKLVKLIDSFGMLVIATTTNILNRLSHKVADLKRHNLVCPVFNQLIVDFRANLFDSIKNGLFAPVIVVEVLNLALIDIVSFESLIQNFQNIRPVDDIYIGINDSPTCQCTSHSHSVHLLQIPILIHIPL